MKKMCAVKTQIKKGGRLEQVCDDARGVLLPRLQEIQNRRGYISDKAMQKLADELGIHPVEVYSVVSFYSFLHTKKKGKYIVRLSQCITSKMAGQEKVRKAFEKELGIRMGETTRDGKITLEETACIGMCDQAPAALVNDELIGKMSPRKVKTLLASLK
ncbi:MAG: NAD(P)H-dependent oxidoreductase subunit E [Candidatus Omnitrophica bacterium]|nr:NAD(P)H-dependent oxidoreductase subunit E [Candidatus Omnitrophota bacterium]